jgi:anti-anti-sigma factor
MELHTKKENGVLIVYLTDEITLSNANEVSDEISSFISDGEIKIIINLNEVVYMDSSAVGMIVATFSNLQGAGGELRLCALKEEVLEIFKAASLDSFLSIDTTEEESLISFQ